MSINKINPDGAINLANAIVEQAAKDYLKAKKKLYLENPENTTRIEKYQWRLEETINFFNSKWYRTLTSIDASWLMKKLDEEFEEWKNDPERQNESFDEE